MGEVNQFKWVGVRPILPYEAIPVFQSIPENAQRVWAYNWAENTWVVVYTVPSGKSLYLCLAILMASAAADGVGMLCVYNDAGTFQYCLAVTRKAAGDGDTYPYLQDNGTEANCVFQMYNMTSANIVNDVP